MKIFMKLTIALVIAFGCVAAYGAEKCTSEPIRADLTGTWTGEDTYSFVFRMDANNRACISIVEPDTTTYREVRDIVVVNGELRHLTYYTPSTDGYVSCVNIKFKGDEMKFHWFGSFRLKQGDDTYVRTKPKTHAINRQITSDVPPA
jgi:hypothetical protein